MNPWLGIAGVSAILAALLWGAGSLGRRAGWPPEVSRKLVHGVMGLLCLAFPWVFDDAWAVGVLALVATLGLMLVRLLPALRGGMGAALHGIGRVSLGELFFAPAVALVFALSGERVGYYLASVLVLTLADAAGALAGTKWGVSRYGSGMGWKSVEGSAAFLFLAIACVAVPLVAEGRFAPGKVMWISLTIGLLATMAEGLSDRGSDNLVLPLWVFFLLSRFGELDEQALMIRCGTVVGLLVLVVVLGKLSTLDGAALLAAALLGYGLAVFGGMEFLLPALGVFGVHLATTWRHGLTGELRHGREPVFAVAVATLPWAAAKMWVGESAALLGCALGAAAMLWIMHLGTRRYLGKEGVGWMGGVVKLLVVLAPVVFWLGVGRSGGLAVAGGLVALASGRMFFGMGDRLGGDRSIFRLARGAFALVPSLVALWIDG